MKIGDKVVCVSADPCRSTFCGLKHPIPLIEGNVYVINGFFVDDLGILGISVIGITKPCPNFSKDTMQASRFRLLDHMKEQQSNLHRLQQAMAQPNAD